MSNTTYISGISAIASANKLVELNKRITECYDSIEDFRMIAQKEGYSFDKQWGNNGVFYIVSKDNFCYMSSSESEVYKQVLLDMGIV